MKFSLLNLQGELLFFAILLKVAKKIAFIAILENLKIPKLLLNVNTKKYHRPIKLHFLLSSLTSFSIFSTALILLITPATSTSASSLCLISVHPCMLQFGLFSSSVLQVFHVSTTVARTFDQPPSLTSLSCSDLRLRCRHQFASCSDVRSSFFSEPSPSSKENRSPFSKIACISEYGSHSSLVY